MAIIVVVVYIIAIVMIICKVFTILILNRRSIEISFSISLDPIFTGLG